MARAGAGAENKDKGGAKKEPETKINNFGSATMWKIGITELLKKYSVAKYFFLPQVRVSGQPWDFTV